MVNSFDLVETVELIKVQRAMYFCCVFYGISFIRAVIFYGDMELLNVCMHLYSIPCREMVVFVTVAGYTACPWYHKALKIVEKLSAKSEDLYVVRNEMDKQTFLSWVRAHKFTGSFTESPSVFLDDGSGAEPESNFVGGYEALEELAKKPLDTWFGTASSE